MKDKSENVVELLRAFLEKEKAPDGDQDIKNLAVNIVDMLQEEQALVIPPGNDELIEHLNETVYKAINDLLKEKPKGINRTSSAAHKAGALKEMPTALAVPTLAGYQYSLSLHQDKEGGAYLQPFRSLEGLRLENGKMFIADTTDNPHLREISEVELQNLQTKEGIDNIDLPLLGLFYTNILYEFLKTGGRELKDVVVIYMPELAARMGWSSNQSKETVQQILRKIQSFHNVVGVLHGTRNGKPVKSYYQVLNFEYYDDKTNNVAFSSPYMNKVISTIYNLSMQKKNGKTLKKSNGDPLLLPNHSYMIDSTIVKEKNKVAAQNVILIVQTIERAGDSIPHLKASTIIERNEQLQERLENTKNKRLILQRAFSGTWELLKSKTRLADFYDGIGVTSDFDKLSQATPLSEVDPKDPALIPNVSTLNDLVFYFPHRGKHGEK